MVSHDAHLFATQLVHPEVPHELINRQDATLGLYSANPSAHGHVPSAFSCLVGPEQVMHFGKASLQVAQLTSQATQSPVVEVAG